MWDAARERNEKREDDIAKLRKELEAALLQIETMKNVGARVLKDLEDANRLNGEYLKVIDEIRRLAREGDSVSSPVLYGLTDFVVKRAAPWADEQKKALEKAADTIQTTDEKRNVSSDTCSHGNAPGWCRAVGCKNESDSRRFR